MVLPWLPEDGCQEDTDVSDVDSEVEGVEDMVDESRGHHQPGVDLGEGRGGEGKGVHYVATCTYLDPD